MKYLHVLLWVLGSAVVLGVLFFATRALAAGKGILGGSGAAQAAESIDQLMARYVGSAYFSVPPAVRRRFQLEAVRVRATGKEGVILWPMSAAENASLPPDWAYLLGRVPDFSGGDLSTDANPWGPGAVWRRIRIKEKDSVLGGVVKPLAGGVLNIIAPGSGTALSRAF